MDPNLLKIYKTESEKAKPNGWIGYCISQSLYPDHRHIGGAKDTKYFHGLTTTSKMTARPSL